MKRIEFILCLLFISTVIFAQNEIAPTKNLDAYTGTWVYQSNDTIFKIVLKKGHVESEYMITNGLVGGYFLSVKGKVVENYLNITSTSRHLDKRDEHIKFYFWASNNATSLDYIDPNFSSRCQRILSGDSRSISPPAIPSPPKCFFRWS